TTALAASNLLRDEAGEILAALAPVAPASPAEPPARETALSSAAPTPPQPNPPPCLDGTTVPIGAGFPPFLGRSSLQPDPVRWVSVNLLGGYARGLRAFEIGAGINLESEFMCGVQFAGVADIVLGPIRGVQFAAIAVAAGDAQGLQAGAGNLAGDSLEGAQLG